MWLCSYCGKNVLLNNRQSLFEWQMFATRMPAVYCCNIFVGECSAKILLISIISNARSCASVCAITSYGRIIHINVLYEFMNDILLWHRRSSCTSPWLRLFRVVCLLDNACQDEEIFRSEREKNALHEIYIHLLVFI